MQHAVERHRVVVAHIRRDAVLKLFKHHRGNARHIEPAGLVERQPDQFDQFLVRPDKAVLAPRDGGHIGGKEPAVEAQRPFRRGNGPGDEVDLAQIGKNAGLGEGLPDAWRVRERPLARDAEHQPGLFIGLADRGKRERGRLSEARPLGAQHQPGEVAVVEPRRSRHQPVGRFDAAARKDEFAGQEPVPLVTAAEQHLRHGLGAVDQDQGRGIPRPDIRETSDRAASGSAVRRGPRRCRRPTLEIVAFHPSLSIFAFGRACGISAVL